MCLFQDESDVKRLCDSVTLCDRETRASGGCKTWSNAVDVLVGVKSSATLCVAVVVVVVALAVAVGI